MLKKEIGTTLKELREVRGIKKVDIGLRNEVIKSIDEGSANYTIDSLIQYADKVGLSVCFNVSARL